MILYIAGPMTGLPGLNFAAFDAAEVELRSAGFTVLNPTRHGQGEPGKEWLDYLVPCLYDVMSANGIALLPGWKSSKGARVESILAKVHGKPQAALETWLNLPISTSVPPW